MKYLIGALVLLALLFLVWWLVSRGKQRQLEEQRAEAARIRAGAEERTAALQGQEAFARQSSERADLARQEAEERARQAEESAREAQRVEEEAQRHQADLERVRLERDAELRRADELDPDVELADDDPRPLPEDLDDDVRPLDETRVHTPVSAEADAPSPVADSVTPSEVESSEAESSEAEPSERNERGWGTGAAVAGAGAAAAGSAYAGTRGNDSDDASQRLASGVDYSDQESATREWAPVDSGRDADSASDQDRGDRRTEETTMSDEELFGAKAAQGDEPVEDQRGEPVESDLRGADRPEEDARRDGSDGGDAAEMTIINDVEDYASTEPLPADEQSPGVARQSEEPAYEGSRDDLGEEDVTARDDSATDEEPTHEETWEDSTDVDRPAVAGDESAGRHAASSVDGDTTEGDSADAGSTDRDATDANSADADSADGDATHWPDGTDRINTLDDDAATDGSGADNADMDGTATDGSDRGGDESGGDESGDGGWSRRTSAVEEIRDGGFGVGSAAPFEDRAQPLDHPVQAYRDTMTYRVPGANGYDSAEPDVWFYDEDAARRAGFNPSEG